MADQMKELVDWLRMVEAFAHELYSHASEFFVEDAQLSAFLEHLAHDEVWHYHLMGSASDFVVEQKISGVSSIEIDPTTMDRIEKPLKEAYDLLLAGTLSTRRIIELVVQAEKSEWNSLFLYAINTLKPFSKLFQRGASVIQSHQDRIEQFLAVHPEGLRYVDAIRQLPAVWRPRFLVVDDDPLIRDLLKDLLSMRGDVETSPDGGDALEITKRLFFDCIVSDISMPTTNGIDFYRLAVEEDPILASRFVFCSGECSLDCEQFFIENQLPRLRKPFKVSELMDAIDCILREKAKASENSVRAVRDAQPKMT
jgi:CheY-like chemotaxis protein